MNEDKILDSMRRMAWQRAKGELYSILETYFSDSQNHHSYDEFDKQSKRIEKFIKEFEDNW